MHHNLLLFAGIDNDWFTVMAVLVIFVVIGSYIRDKARQKKDKETDWGTTDKPFRKALVSALSGVCVALSYWAYKKFTGHL